MVNTVGEGVYEVQVFFTRIRIIVANQLPEEEHNAMLHLFSSNVDLVNYGVAHCQRYSQETSTLLLRLYQRYQEEGQIMPDMLEEFARETIDQLLKNLPIEKRLEGLTPEQLLAGLTPEQRRALAEKLKADGSSPKSE